LEYGVIYKLGKLYLPNTGLVDLALEAYRPIALYPIRSTQAFI